jgi:hypothetical protein
VCKESFLTVSSAHRAVTSVVDYCTRTIGITRHRDYAPGSTPATSSTKATRGSQPGTGPLRRAHHRARNAQSLRTLLGACPSRPDRPRFVALVPDLMPRLHPRHRRRRTRCSHRRGHRQASANRRPDIRHAGGRPSGGEPGVAAQRMAVVAGTSAKFWMLRRTRDDSALCRSVTLGRFCQTTRRVRAGRRRGDIGAETRRTADATALRRRLAFGPPNRLPPRPVGGATIRLSVTRIRRPRRLSPQPSYFG